MLGSDADIKILNSLTTTTIDSADGFERSAETVDDPALAETFRAFASERRAAVARLQQRVRDLGGEPNDDGSLTAGVHRRWEDMKRALSANDDKAVIDEVERGEDHIKEKYEAALADAELSAASQAVVRDCFDTVRRGHDRASQLKHGLEAAGRPRHDGR